MAKRKLIPELTKSTGRKSTTPTASLGSNGMLSLNVAAAKLLGEPERVAVEDDLAVKCFYIQPTTPNDTGGWSLSGGGNTTYRIRLKKYVSDYDKAGMVGEYAVSKAASGIALWLKQTAS